MAKHKVDDDFNEQTYLEHNSTLAYEDVDLLYL